MTQKSIKEQFKPGDRWRVKREGTPLTVRGNLGNTVLGSFDCDELRTIARVQERCLVSIQPDGREIDTAWPWPKTEAAIVTAEPGKLVFRYTCGGPLVTMTKET